MKTETEINAKIQELFAKVEETNHNKELCSKIENKIWLTETSLSLLTKIEALQWVMIEGVTL